jgi:putative ABC transport system permease protein
MIGADFVVRADYPVEPLFASPARSLGLATARTTIFLSMVSCAVAASASAARHVDTDAPVSRLAALKAVSSGYLLRGRVRIIRPPGTPRPPRPAPCD